MCEIDSNLTFTQALRNHPELIERSRYKKLLSPYLESLAPGKLKIFFYEDLEADPELFFYSVCSYLEVPEMSFVPPNTSTLRSGKALRWPFASKIVKYCKQSADLSFRYFGQEKRWEKLKAKYQSLYQGLLALNYEPHTMPRKDREFLQLELREDVQFIRELANHKKAFIDFGD
jgi:hypothetical protein